jgi:hypothetical protein
MLAGRLTARILVIDLVVRTQAATAIEPDGFRGLLYIINFFFFFCSVS